MVDQSLSPTNDLGIKSFMELNFKWGHESWQP